MRARALHATTETEDDGGPDARRRQAPSSLLRGFLLLALLGRAPRRERLQLGGEDLAHLLLGGIVAVGAFAQLEGVVVGKGTLPMA